MKQERIPISFTLVLSCIAVLWLALGAVVIRSLTYEGLIVHVLEISGKHHLESALRETYFSPGKFRWLQILLPTLSITGMAIIALFWKKLGRIHFFRHFPRDLQQSWQVWQPAGRWETWLFSGILLFIAAKALYYLVTSELNYDEAWAFSYFTSNPWYLTPFIYSNYPLHELLTHFTKWLPLPMYINLRLPAFLVGMVWLVAVYLCTARIWNRRAGLVGMALMGTLPPAALYMLQAKGFLGVALCTLLLLTLLHLAYREGWTAKRRRWYVLAIFFGCWSSPIFALPLATLSLCAGLLFLLRDGKGLLTLTGVTMAGVAAGAILYLPVLIGTGLAPLYNASPFQSESPPHHTMWWHIKFISLWLTGWSWGWMLILTALALFLGWLTGRNRLVALCGIASLLTIVLIPVITGSYVFPRVWLFLVVPLGLAFTGLLSPILRDTRTAAVLALFFLGVNTYSYAVYVERTWSIPWNRSSEQVAKILLDNNVTTYYTDFDYLLPVVEYHYRLAGLPVSAQVTTPGSLRYGDEEQMATADAIIDSGKRGLHIPGNYPVIYSDSILKVYLRP